MDREFWLSRWSDNQIGFHRKGVNPLLVRFWPTVSTPGPGSVLAPLCGKSEDLRWLSERGHEVTGVELSLIAVKAFAAEQGIVMTETHEPPFTVLRGRGITLHAGDFFDFTPARGGRFDLVYDRAALIALPPEMRPAYVKHLRSLLKDSARGLLITVEYDSSAMHGPPFSVAEPEVRRLFQGFACEKLVEADCLEDEPRFKARGLTWMKEVAYYLSCKPDPTDTPGGIV